MRRGRWLGLGACFVVLGCSMVLVACGGGGTETSGSEFSKTEFLQEGNAICKKGTRQVKTAAERRFPRSGGTPIKAERLAFVSQTVIPSIQRQIDELEVLGFPKGEEETVETILAEMQNGLNQAKKEPSALIAGGPGPFASADKFANSYGLTACGAG